MSQLGLGVMKGMLFGEGRENDIIRKSIGKEIESVSIEDDRLVIKFKDGSIVLRDDGQLCCGRRYMQCDDDIGAFLGAKLAGIKLKDGSVIEDEYGSCKESQFLEVETSRGSFTVVNYNEHNGYYGGFFIICEEGEPCEA